MKVEYKFLGRLYPSEITEKLTKFGEDGWSVKFIGLTPPLQGTYDVLLERVDLNSLAMNMKVYNEGDDTTISSVVKLSN